MPLVSALTKSLQVKIVYYGPGLSGKTTNLEKLSVMLDKERVGDLMSLDTSGDRTLFFDWMPLDLGKIRGFDVKIQLYTVPGQIRYDRTRQQVLRGVDGIVFIADSQRDASEQNIYSFKNLRDNLALSGRDLEEIPVVIQCNKKDLPNTMTTREMALLLHAEHLPFIEAAATTGQGIMETLRLITRLTMKHVQAYLDPSQVRDAPEQKEALDGDTLLSKMLSSEAILKEHREAEQAPAPLGGAVPSPEDIDRADSSELTPVVEIIEEPLVSGPANAAPPVVAEEPSDVPSEMEIEAEPSDDGVPVSEPPVSGQLEVTTTQNGEKPSDEVAAPESIITPQEVRETPATLVEPAEKPAEAGSPVEPVFTPASVPQAGAAEIAELRGLLDAQSTRIQDLETTVGRQTVALQLMGEQLAKFKKAFADLGRQFE